MCYSNVSYYYCDLNNIQQMIVLMPNHLYGPQQGKPERKKTHPTLSAALKLQSEQPNQAY